MDMFPNAHLQGLGSDACPLLLQTNMGQMHKAWFHFEVFWPKFDDYEETVAQAWKRPDNIPDPLMRLDIMLRELVRELQRWSSTRIGEIRAQLLMARELVLRLDTAQEERRLSMEEAELRKRMKMRCLGLSSLDRTITRQRARVRHLQEGDVNTAYFHILARGRKRRNFITSLNVHGHLVANHDEMQMALHEHFAGVFGTAAATGSTLNFQALGIQPVDLTNQDAPFAAQEVWAAIKAMPADKVPGPNGFTGAFYKSAWNLIQPEMMGA